MLIQKNYTGRTKSIFLCDRCKRKIETDKNDRYRVVVQKTPNSLRSNQIQAWDLCERCYSALDRGIKKGVINKNYK